MFIHASFPFLYYVFYNCFISILSNVLKYSQCIASNGAINIFNHSHIGLCVKQKKQKKNEQDEQYMSKKVRKLRLYCHFRIIYNTHGKNAR